MCIVCRDWQKGNLTLKEAKRNLGEMINTSDDYEEREHYFKVLEGLLNETDEN